METLRDIITAAIGSDSTPEARRVAFIQALQARPDSEPTAAIVRELTPTPEAAAHSIAPPAEVEEETDHVTG